MVCERCQDKGTVPCPRCQGKTFGEIGVFCELCDGDGYIWCPECNGDHLGIEEIIVEERQPEQER